MYKKEFKISFFFILFAMQRVCASIYTSQFMSLDSISKYPDATYYFGVFRFESMQYFTNLPEGENLNSQQYFSTRLGLTGNFENKWGYGIDVQAGKFNYGSSNYSIQEIYSYYRFENSFRLIAGRKKYDWSILDSYWKTSLWQPNYAIDYLRPEEQGLFGVFFEYQRPEFQFVTYTTPMFIPNIGIDVREEGGELKSDSRWFRKPSNKYDLNGRIKSLTYSLSVPEFRDLVSKPGAGLNMGIGDRIRGWWVNQSVAYKPVNELLLKRQDSTSATDAATNVVVSPDVTYHSVFSFDLGYTFNEFRIVTSYLEDNPKAKIANENWTIQQLAPIKAYSVMLENNVDSEMIKNLKIQIGYLKVFGGTIEDRDSQQAKDDFTLFEERTNFYNSLMFKTQGQFFKIYNKSVITKFSYLRDFDQNGSLVNTEMQIYPMKDWAILLGGDFISVDDEKSLSSGFLNQYRANDRFYGGINYVF